MEVRYQRKCPSCGYVRNPVDKGPGHLCQQCRFALPVAEPQPSDADSVKIDIENIIVTTTPSIDGYRIARVVDVVTAECVFGMNIFKDLLASFSDFFGGRSGASQSTLREARKTCIRELKTEAYQLGANAVIGIDLDYSEFSGAGKSMLFLVASGTAVVLEKIETASPNIA